MKQFLTRFIHDRRGAVALMFAATLLPLVLLIGLSIDYSFAQQARAQFNLSSDASAMYALREASAIYTIQTKQTNPVAVGTATSNAITGGQNAGTAWFGAQLGTLPTATNSSGSPSITVCSTDAGSGNCTAPGANSGSAGFAATVTYTGTYPPFFNRLFHRSSSWPISGQSDAVTSFNYLELLVLMDDSSSMLVSADQGSTSNSYGTPDGLPISSSDPGTVATMDLNTVCMPNSWMDSTNAGSGDLQGLISGSFIGYYEYKYGAYSTTSTNSPFIDWANVKNLTNASKVTLSGHSTFSVNPTCQSGMNSFVPTSQNGGSGYPVAPCAFACHTATSTQTHTLQATNSAGANYTTTPFYTYMNQQLQQATSGTYPNDLYGVARQLGVELKIDKVLQSTETMINQLIDAEQIPGQFTVGMYTFNGDACPIVNGKTDTTTSAPLSEATPDLQGALSAIQAIDYTYTPTETSFPPAITPASGNGNGDTNFPLSVSDLIAGTVSAGNANIVTSKGILNCPTHTDATALATPSTMITAGSQANNPQKDIFIITDGLEDSYASSVSGGGTCTNRQAGEMTSFTDEANKSTTNSTCDSNAVCTQLKNLGFTIYVLYIPYPSTQHPFFYTNEGTSMQPDPYLSTDFPSSVFSNSSSEADLWINGSSAISYTGSSTVTSPDKQALTACASTTDAGTSDLFEADSTADISTKMQQMLASALNSAIRITQ